MHGSWFFKELGHNSQNFLNIITNLDFCGTWSSIYIWVFIIIMKYYIMEGLGNQAEMFVKPIVYAKSDWLF